MHRQIEYSFEEEEEEQGTLEKAAKFIWNSKNKEFLGRDGASWGKYSILCGLVINLKIKVLCSHRTLG